MTRLLKKSPADAKPSGQEIADLLAGLSSAELDALGTAVRARADSVYSAVTASLKGWALAGSFLLTGSQTYDATYGTLTGANITWPDGATGVFASTGIDTTSTNPGGLTGFTATHVLSGTTKTATVVIPRNGSGQVSGAMTVTVA